MRSVDFALYLITDRKVMKTSFYEAVEEALRAGVKALQLREKDLTVRELLQMSYKLRELTSAFGARLFINDRVDVAMAVQADGVHLGGASMPVSAVRRIVGNGLMIGVSTHHIKEAATAEAEGADFITFGPVYDTPSKRQYGPPQGIERLREVTSKIRIPVFAIGGIKKDKVSEVLDAGAHGVALISAILGSDNIQESTKKIVRLLK